MDTSKLLLVTPPPVSGESFYGYVRRLSKANRCLRPTLMLRHMVLHHRSLLGMKLKYEHVRRVTNLEIAEMERIWGPEASDKKDAKSYIVNRHALSKHLITCSCNRVCLECFSENGIIPALWDVKAYKACHKHRKWLTELCNDCLYNLNEKREKTSKCSCNRNYEQVASAYPSTAFLELMSCINAVAHRVSLFDNNSECGIPLSSLSGLKLETLLLLLNRLSGLWEMLHIDQYANFSDPRYFQDSYATEVLVDWPNNFYRLLSLYGEQCPGKETGLTGQFSNLLSRLFKSSIPAGEIKFIKTAFIEFGLKEWSGAHVDRRLLKQVALNTQINYSSVAEYARVTGFTPRQIKELIRAARLQCKTLSTGKRERSLIVINPEELPRARESLKRRQAADYVKLPYSVFNELVKTSKFKFQTLCKPLTSLALQDLDNFVNSICSRSIDDYRPAGTLSLEAVMRKKLKIDGIKIQIMSLIMEGRLKCYGPAQTLSELHVSANHIDILSGSIIGRDEGMCLYREAAFKLGIRYEDVSRLVEARVLPFYETRRGKMTSIASVEYLISNYTVLSTIAEKNNFSLKELKEKCKEKDVLLVAARTNSLKSTFVPNNSIPSIL